MKKVPADQRDESVIQTLPGDAGSGQPFDLDVGFEKAGLRIGRESQEDSLGDSVVVTSSTQLRKSGWSGWPQGAVS